MGLHTVEFIMQLEDQFDVKLEDVEVLQVRVVSDMVALITAKLEAQGRPVPNVFWEIKQILIERWGHVPWHVQPDSSFVDDLGFG